MNTTKQMKRIPIVMYSSIVYFSIRQDNVNLYAVQNALITAKIKADISKNRRL